MCGSKTSRSRIKCRCRCVTPREQSIKTLSFLALTTAVVSASPWPSALRLPLSLLEEPLADLPRRSVDALSKEAMVDE